MTRNQHITKLCKQLLELLEYQGLWDPKVPKKFSAKAKDAAINFLAGAASVFANMREAGTIDYDITSWVYINTLRGDFNDIVKVANEGLAEPEEKKEEEKPADV